MIPVSFSPVRFLFAFFREVDDDLAQLKHGKIIEGIFSFGRNCKKLNSVYVSLHDV